MTSVRKNASRRVTGSCQHFVLPKLGQMNPQPGARRTRARSAVAERIPRGETEHILLGLLRVEEGLAALVLGSFNVTVEGVRGQVATIVGEGYEVTDGQIPFTPRAKKVLGLSLR